MDSGTHQQIVERDTAVEHCAERRRPAGPDLPGRIDMWLDALGLARVRVSLFAFSLAGPDTGRALAALEAEFGSLGFVGRLGEAAVGLFHCGPRPKDDAALERAVADRARRALTARLPAAAQRLRVVGVHRWAHEIDDAEDLLTPATAA